MAAARRPPGVPRLVEDFRQSGYTDTQTLQAALDAGGWLYLDRAYTITDRPTCNVDNTIVSGPGLVSQSTANKGVVLVYGANVTFSGVRFDGSSTTSESDVYGISFVGDDGKIVNSTIGGFTVGATLAGDRCSVLNSFIDGSVGDGSGQGYGVLVLAPNCTVSGNRMRLIGRHGVYMSGNATYGGAINGTVTGNVVELDNAKSDGIKVYATSVQTAVTGVSVTGNVVKHSNPQSGAACGLSVFANVSDCVISGNTVAGTNSVGLKVASDAASSPARIVFVGNTVNCSSGYFIKVEESGSNYPTDCLFRDNTTNLDSFTGIYDQGTRTVFQGNSPYPDSGPIQEVWTSPSPAAAATPSVYKGRTFTVTNGSGTTITNLLHGKTGQTVTLIFADGNTTVSHGSNFKLAGGSNFVGTANDSLTLVNSGGVWYETARSVNG